MKHFNNLLKKGLIDYRKYLNGENQAAFEKLLSMNQEDAYRDFQSLTAAHSDPDILLKISNPFYVGMGNPQSKILLFGQELAIDIDIKKESSLMGFFQEQLYHHPLLDTPVNDFFNPYRANNFRKIKRHSHTWGVYSKWVAAFKDGDAKKFKKYLFDEPRKEYFEDHCFYTELYEVPSPKHKKSTTTSEREKFFQSSQFREFLGTFDYVLIGCSSFYKNHEHLLSEFWGITPLDILAESKSTHNCAGKKGVLFKTKKGQKFGIINYQFSSAWSYDYINEISIKLQAL